MTVTTQAELDAALAAKKTNIECCGAAEFSISGSATVRAYGSATVWAYDSATVRAYGSATVWASMLVRVLVASIYVTITAGATVAVQVECAGKPKIKGGIVIRAKTALTIRAWADDWGATIEGKGKAASILMGKALDADMKSPHGMAYLSGTTVTAPDWDGGKAECGAGLHACALAGISRDRFHPEAKRYALLRVKLSDCRKPQASDQYPNKLKFSKCEVVAECDEFNRPLKSQP